jgi:membrane associated rhomboid family serine protease
MAFFQDQKSPREPFLRAPMSVIGLIAVILAAHAARVVIPGGESNEFILTYGLIPARYAAEIWAAAGAPPVSIWDALVPFVSHLFIHADFLHVGVNCIWLLVAGTPVARRIGALRLLALFLVTGVIAGAAFVAANWGGFDPAVGASGAVSGMMGAAIRIFYGERMAAALRLAGQAETSVSAPLAPLFSGAVLFFSAIWVVVNVIAGVTGLGTSGDMQAVAWEAHLGGYFAGLILIGLFGRSAPAAA